MDRYPHYWNASGDGAGGDTTGGDTAGGAELLDDRIRRISPTKSASRLGMSVPGAMAAAFLVAALAFGASIQPDQPKDHGAGGATAAETTKPTAQPNADRPTPRSTTDAGHETAAPTKLRKPTKPSRTAEESSVKGSASPDVVVEETPASTAKPTRKPTPKSTVKPTPKPTVKPTPKPTVKPTPKPAPAAGTLELTVAVVDGRVLLDWSECGAAGFDYYKVVRSKDSTATWPAGDHDALVAAVGPDGTTALKDKEAPTGTTLWYRVFCVDKTGEGYVVRAASASKAIDVPVTEPKPTPVAQPMTLDARATAHGVVLTWQQAAHDGFAFYKVVRSRNPDPSYLPGTEGSEVVAVIENGGVVSFVDSGADAGLWYYRVQSIGLWEDHKVLLGQTAAVAVTVG